MNLGNDLCCVIFTNYNGQERRFLGTYLDTLIKSVDEAQTKGASAKIIGVDDGSTDDSLKELKVFENERKQIVEILQTKNVDVTGAINHGIRYVLNKHRDCRYIVTNDVDTALSKGFLIEILKKAKQSHSRTGMFASNQFLLDLYPELNVHRSTGHYISLGGATLDRDFMERASTRRKKILCPCISGALFKTDMLKEIGLVPKEYLHYNNCPELGFRAQFAGWSVEFVDSAIMWHNKRDQSKISYEQKRQRELSRIWNILRFFPGDKVSNALKTYKREQFNSSPPLKEKEEIIREAKEAPIAIFKEATEEQKRIVYNKFVLANSQ
jgi:GT2 family glycosyltransferase